jgi:hypothetical protein
MKPNRLATLALKVPCATLASRSTTRLKSPKRSMSECAGKTGKEQAVKVRDDEFRQKFSTPLVQYLCTMPPMREGDSQGLPPHR